jgi:hypothetical protein
VAVAAVAGAVLPPLISAPEWSASAASPGPGAAPGSGGAYVLAATSTGGKYAPTFTGNGYIGLRVPPAGQGYAGGSVPTGFTLAGFYAQAPGQVQQRANLPAWSGLAFSDGGQDFSLTTGRVSGWRQQLDLHDGVITTTATWTAPNVHPPAAPVKTLRASSYDLVVSANGRDWTVVASITGRTTGTRDTLTFPAVRARYVGVGITAATYDTPPILEELAVPAA